MKEQILIRKIYPYEELSREAQHKAHYDYLRTKPFKKEKSHFVLTYRAFCRMLDINCFMWDADTFHGYTPPKRIDIRNRSMEYLMGKELQQYLAEHDSYYTDYYIRTKGTYSIQELCDHHLLTGFWADEKILAPLMHATQGLKEYDTYPDLLRACLQNLFEAMLDEWCYTESEEGFLDYCKEHSLFFAENGDRVDVDGESTTLDTLVNCATMKGEKAK